MFRAILIATVSSILPILAVTSLSGSRLAAGGEPVFDAVREWDFEDGQTGGWTWYDNWSKPTLGVTGEALTGKHSLNVKFDDKSTARYFHKGFRITLDPPIPWSELSFLSFRYNIEGEVSHFRIMFCDDTGKRFRYDDPHLVIGKPGHFYMTCDRLRGIMRGKVRVVWISLHNKQINKLMFSPHKELLRKAQKFSFTVDDIVLGTDICRAPFQAQWKESRPYLAVAARAQRAVSVDGKLDDWGGAVPIALARPEQLSCQARKWHGPADLSAVAAVLWDEEYLYFAVNVCDDKVVCADPPSNYPRGQCDLSRNDSVRLYLNTSPVSPEAKKPLGPHDYAFCATPLSPGNDQPMLVLCPYRGDEHKDFAIKSVRIASSHDGEGWRIEMAIPWAALKFEPAEAKRLRFFTLVDDSDRPGGRDQEMIWRSVPGQYWMDPSCWGRLLLTRPLSDIEAISAAAATGSVAATTERSEYEMNTNVLSSLNLWWPLAADPGKCTWKVLNSVTNKPVGRPAIMPPVKTPLSTRLASEWNCGATEDGTYSLWCGLGEPEKEKVSIEGRVQLIGPNVDRRPKDVAQSKQELGQLQARLKTPDFRAPESWLVADRLHGRRGRAYPKRVDPAKWSLAKDPVTWEDLDGQFQGHAQVGISPRSLDTYFKHYDFGRCVKGSISATQAETWRPAWEDAARRGLMICDVYVPGGVGGQPLKEKHEALRAVMGRRFFGYEVGEQDGHYLGSVAPGHKPKSRRDAQKLFWDWTEQRGKANRNNVTFHHYCVAVGSSNMSHQYGAMGCYRILGLECAQALPSDIMEWAFLRGACKQYGLLSWNIISVFNRWGYKNYMKSGSAYHEYGPDKGTSVSLMKRLYYVTFMYGSASNGFESAYMTEEKDAEGYPELSPVGQVNVEAVKWCRKHAIDRGVQYTPVALLIDFASGWTPPRHSYLVWGNMPYEKGDYQIDNFFRWVFPQYEDCSYFKDERGFLTATPFGDKFDVLTSDAQQRILDQYSVVCLLGELEVTDELAAKLKRFVEQGGDLITSAAQARVLGADFCGVNVSEKMRRGYGSLSLADRKVFHEKDYNYYEMTPTSAQVLAVSEHKLPLITVAESGRGRVIVIAPDYWMSVRLKVEDDPNDASPPVHPSRYEILKVVQHALGQYFKDLDFVRIDGPEIQYIVNLNENTKRLLLTLVNNSQADWQGTISLVDKTARLVLASEWMEERDLPLVLPIKLSVPKGDLRIVEIVADRALFAVK
ncbi:sugar-binding protein [Pseudomonas sp.]|uniref:sugar-binding protein n=1 Tax=Pseudomonas sp. TaxID=306 RepID=UPI00272ADB8B|nr:sugar-binding protein [Pseudomonas sp.]